MRTTDKDEAWLINSRHASLYALAGYFKFNPGQRNIIRIDQRPMSSS